MKKFFITLAIILGVLVVLATTFIVGIGYYLSPQSKLEKADAIVVISGGQTTSRADKGIDLYKQGYSKNIIFSGAALDDGPSNAAAMQQQALDAGVSAKVIYTDEASQDTYQNAVNSKEILQKLDEKKIILVTSPYHQRRAYETFKQVLGPDYTILNASAFDDRWSKSRWWEKGFASNITLSESAKLFYILVTGNYK
ncbi:MAG: YdcF family protein [Candidatus Saccharibacteria bacterium]